MDLKTNKNWAKQQGSNIRKQKLHMAESAVDDIVKTFKAIAFVESIIVINWDHYIEQYKAYHKAKEDNRLGDDIIKEYQDFCLSVIDRADKARKSVDSKLWKKHAMNLYHQM